MSVDTNVHDPVPTWIPMIQGGSVPFFCLAHADETDWFTQQSSIRPIVFDKGRIMFDRFTVTKPQFSGESVSWTHQSDRGFTSANLIYGKSGTEMSGVVSIGDDPETATDAYVFATAIPLSEYETKIHRVAMPTSSSTLGQTAKSRSPAA